MPTINYSCFHHILPEQTLKIIEISFHDLEYKQGLCLWLWLWFMFMLWHGLCLWLWHEFWICYVVVVYGYGFSWVMVFFQKHRSLKKRALDTICWLFLYREAKRGTVEKQDMSKKM